MVCECRDNTIQLWSLHTGKQLWKRDVVVQKYYHSYCRKPRLLFGNDDDDDYEPYRPVLSYHARSLYRSVVFHPTEDLVLPGILSHAYTFDGDLKPLFLSSECLFSVCSISADKTEMLTDCTNDAKSIIMWSLTDGSEISRFTWSHDIVSFAWSRDGRLLAISDPSGSIGLLDVMDGYRTLAQTTIPEVCGMIKFSPDCRCLYCLVFNSARCDLFRLDVNMKNDANFSLDVLPNKVSYELWEFESCGETGFLLGDPFYSSFERYTVLPGLAFVLNKQSVLRVSYSDYIVEMLQLDELSKDSAGVSKTTVTNVVLSLNGDALFVITTTGGSPATLKVWDISSGMFKPGRRVLEDTGELDEYNLVAVREGVLLETSHDTLELWNFELTECIRRWTDFGVIIKVIPISEERVACDGLEKVIIVDTTSREGILSKIPINGMFVACNSKCQVITSVEEELQMQCGDKVLWKISQPFKFFGFPLCCTFSPTEQYFVLPGYRAFYGALYVLDVVSGKTLHTIQPCTRDLSLIENLQCKCVSDEECVTCFNDEVTGYFLQLFNIKSGDLLSEIALESRVLSLAACTRERLIAIGFEDSKVSFKVLRVKLLGDKHSRKNKRSGFVNE